MEISLLAPETLQKTRCFSREFFAFSATTMATPNAAAATQPPRLAPIPQNENSKSAFQNNRSPRLQFRALRQTPPLRTPAEFAQSRPVSAPNPQKTRHDSR